MPSSPRLHILLQRRPLTDQQSPTFSFVDLANMTCQRVLLPTLRLPADLRAFLSASNGFSLAWTARQRAPPPGGAGGSGDVFIGRVCVDALSAITRVPLDADDLRDVASSRARATAAAAAAAKARSLPRGRACPRPFSPSPSDAKSNGEGRAVVGSSIAADASSSGGASSEGGYGSSSAYGIAAFCLDSSCEVGRVALVYGGDPIAGCIDDIGGRSNNKQRERSRGGTKASATRALSSPEVWLQDLSCR